MKVFKLELLSEHRSAIMGFAMIWVVLYHFRMHGLLSVITRFGFTGVDLFMFASGLGLYYSMLKDENVKNFYSKRIIRIIPIYYLLGLVYDLLSGDFKFLTYLWRYSTLGFWTDGIYGNGWFIPSIVALYLIYPYIYRTLFKNKVDKFAMIILVSIIFFFIIYVCFKDQSVLEINHFLLLYRFPVFLAGSLVGFILNEKQNLRQLSRLFVRLSFFLIPLTVVFFLIDHSSSYGIYFSTTFLTPLILLFLCWLFENIGILKTILGGGRKCFSRNIHDSGNTFDVFGFKGFTV